MFMYVLLRDLFIWPL